MISRNSNNVLFTLALLLGSAGSFPTLAADAPTPPTFQHQVEMSMHYLEQGRYSEAADAAQGLVNSEPNASLPYQVRGTVAMMVGDVPHAKADFATAYSKNSHEAISRYGAALCAMMSKEDAIPYLRDAQADGGLNDQQKADIVTALAYIQFMHGDAKGARVLIDGPAGDSDKTRQDLAAMIAAHLDPKAGISALTEFLKTPNEIPRVQEDTGVRFGFDQEPKMVEASIVEPALQHMYRARIAQNIPDSDDQSLVKYAKLSGIVELSPARTNNKPIRMVTYYVDGGAATIINTPPFIYHWDTSRVLNGSHTVVVQAKTDDGSDQLETRKVIVDNGTGDQTSTGDTDTGLDPQTYQTLEDRLWNIIRLRPSYKVAEMVLGRIELRLGDKEDAGVHFVVATALDPEFGDSRITSRSLLRHAAPATSRSQSYRTKGVWSGNPNIMMVALTFDDGPTRAKTPILLDALDKAHARGTFFVVGSRVEEVPDLVRRMVAAGDEVENHSYTHPNIAQCIPSTVESEIVRTNVVIRSLTGRYPSFFRPPGGDASPTLLRLSQDYGMVLAFWSLDTLNEESTISPSEFVTYVMKHIHPGAIVLMHNGSETTAAAVPQLVAALRAKGFKPVTLQELLAH